MVRIKRSAVVGRRGRRKKALTALSTCTAAKRNAGVSARLSTVLACDGGRPEQWEPVVRGAIVAGRTRLSRQLCECASPVSEGSELRLTKQFALPPYTISVY